MNSKQTCNYLSLIFIPYLTVTGMAYGSVTGSRESVTTTRIEVGIPSPHAHLKLDMVCSLVASLLARLPSSPGEGQNVSLGKMRASQS